MRQLILNESHLFSKAKPSASAGGGAIASPTAKPGSAVIGREEAMVTAVVDAEEAVEII